jgi:hypothetical protein
LNYFTSAVRLKKVLDGLDISEENVESFLEEINIHCFKKNIDKKEFILKIDEVWKIAESRCFHIQYSCTYSKIDKRFS